MDPRNASVKKEKRYHLLLHIWSMLSIGWNNTTITVQHNELYQQQLPSNLLTLYSGVTGSYPLWYDCLTTPKRHNNVGLCNMSSYNFSPQEEERMILQDTDTIQGTIDNQQEEN
uniref:Uncharacterized protein n=1 Tax=Glossina pallidipes TaxID=7398 RepID=A0A1A9ZCN6_GLOPL